MGVYFAGETLSNLKRWPALSHLATSYLFGCPVISLFVFSRDPSRHQRQGPSAETIDHGLLIFLWRIGCSSLWLLISLWRIGCSSLWLLISLVHRLLIYLVAHLFGA